MCQLHYASPRSRALFGWKSIGRQFTVLKHLTESSKLIISHWIAPRTADRIMPSRLLPSLAFCAIAGFVGFAFRQGTKVKPDKNNTDNWDRFGGPPDSHTGLGM
jgi:hypothetical protein